MTVAPARTVALCCAMLTFALTLAAFADEPTAGTPPAAAPAAGIGARLRGHVYADVPSVELTLPGSPADRAGLRNGDLILTVDGWDTTGHELIEVIQHIGGEPGTDVALAVQRDGEVLELTVRREVMRDLVTAQTAAEATQCPVFWEALKDRANNFENLRGEVLPENADGYTHYSAKSALPTASSTQVEVGLSTLWTADFGTTATRAEGEKKLDEVVLRLRPCLADFWLVREVARGLPVVYFGLEHANGWYGSLGAFQLRSDGIVNLYIEKADVELYKALPIDPPSGPWVETLLTIAAAAPTNFDSLRGAAHTDGNPFNASRWNDATLMLAGTKECVVNDGGIMDSTFYECPLARGQDPAIIGDFFDKAQQIVGQSLGHDWVYWYDEAPAPHDRHFVHYAKRTTRGYDKTAVITLGLSETGVTLSVSQQGLM